MYREDDRAALEERLSDFAEIAQKFTWGELADRVPVGSVFLRPESEGEYLAIEWRARWADQVGGQIILEIAGYLNEDHQTPIISRSYQIEKKGFFADLLRR